jgi:pimeloyl-ACP methyl ester carboxylesterase
MRNEKAAPASTIANPNPSGAEPPIVLVHGAFADAPGWGHVAGRLKAAGREVHAIDLPGRAGNPMAPGDVTLDRHRDTLLACLNVLGRPAVVVGHSFAGIVIAAAAEQAPEKVATLVFVAAYLPKDGESLVSMAMTDPDAKIGAHLKIDKEKGIASVDYAARAELFANDGPAPLKARLPDLILDEPLAPLGTPVKVSDAAFGQVEKVYVQTSLDQVVSPALQARMIAATPVRKTVTLATGHLPFLTDPDGLAQAIAGAAE